MHSNEETWAYTKFSLRFLLDDLLCFFLYEYVVSQQINTIDKYRVEAGKHIRKPM
jgi:hypothetical protein